MSSNAYDIARPPDATTAANIIGTEIQRAKKDLQERLMQGGLKFAAIVPPAPSTVENNDGRPCVGIETQTNQNDQGYITLAWDFAGTTFLVRAYGPSHATKANKLEAVGNIIAPQFEGTATRAYSATVRAILADSVPVAAAYITRVAYKVPNATGAPSRTLDKITLVAGGRPTATDLVVTVRKLAAPAVGTARFADASSTQIASATLTAASANYAVEVTGLAQTLAVDDELVIKYGATVGGAVDVSIILQIL